MKFSINRQVLIKHLSDVQRAISSRTTIPILTGVKISADENGIVLSGSDSDISIQTLIPVSEENNQI